MALQSSDQFLVNRGDKSYSLTAQQLQADIGGGGGSSPIKPPVVLSPHNGSGNSVGGGVETEVLSGKLLSSELVYSNTVQSLTLESWGAAESIASGTGTVRLTDGSLAADGSYADFEYSPFLNEISAHESVSDGVKLTFTGTAADDNKDLKLIHPGQSIVGVKNTYGGSVMTIAGGNGRWIYRSGSAMWAEASDIHWYRGKPCYLWQNGKRTILGALTHVRFGEGLDGKGRFVATNGLNVFYSDDAENWYRAEINVTDTGGFDLVYSGGVWLVGRTTNSNVWSYISYDGKVWKQAGKLNSKGITGFNGVFYSITNADKVTMSRDGKTWTVASGNPTLTISKIFAGTDENGRELVFTTRSQKDVYYRYLDTWDSGLTADWVQVTTPQKVDLMTFDSENFRWVGAHQNTLCQSIGGTGSWTTVAGILEVKDLTFANDSFALVGVSAGSTRGMGGGIGYLTRDLSASAWDPSVTPQKYCPPPEIVVSVDVDTNSLIVSSDSGKFWHDGDTIDVGPSIYYGQKAGANVDDLSILITTTPSASFSNNWPDSDNRLGTDLYVSASAISEEILASGVVPLLSTPFKAEPADTLTKIIWEIDGTEVDAGTSNPYTPTQFSPGPHTVRVKHVGTNSGDSAWSPPVQFVTGQSDESQAVTASVSVAQVTREVIRQMKSKEAEVGTTDLVDELPEEGEDEAS